VVGSALCSIEAAAQAAASAHGGIDARQVTLYDANYYKLDNVKCLIIGNELFMAQLQRNRI
jgi:hypothetical protein